MDRPFDYDAWQPTKEPEPGDTDLKGEFPDLVEELKVRTSRVHNHPYHPLHWYERGKTLAKLRYPELAVSDAYKASLLCRSLLDRLTDDTEYRLGYGAGFWMSDSPRNPDVHDQDELEQSLANLLSDAYQLQIENLYFFPQFMEGRFLNRLYPWTEQKHRQRSDELIRMVSDEFGESARHLNNTMMKSAKFARRPREPYCSLRRHAFGEFSVDGKDSSDVLGVFATDDIRKGAVVLVDETTLWGCSGPGVDGNMSHCRGIGCADPVHPNLPSDDGSRDLRWIRDRADKDAGDVILRCRFLAHCIADDVAHPLDHPLVARLTPTYRKTKVRLFSLENDIAIPNDYLQQAGIDIFANPSYDAWVLFTLGARIENNSWSDPVHKCVSPLFSLFNHSCDPNVEWRIMKDKTTLMVTAMKDIKKGEQMFVMYDVYMAGQPLSVRRRRLRRWFDADCQCTLCLKEEAEEALQRADDEKCTCGCDGCEGRKAGVPNWDDMPAKPVFPEDRLRITNSGLRD